MEGTKANFTSEQGGGILGIGAHSTSSFVKDITAFTKAFANSKGNSKKLINDFISTLSDS